MKSFVLIFIILLMVAFIIYLISMKNKDCEKDIFKFIVRAQLPYNNEKQDTYFADYEGKTVFVKGPFLDKEVIKNSMFNKELRKILGLNYIPSKIIYLYPDLKLNNVGIKKLVDPTLKYPFIISKDISGGNVRKYNTYLIDGKEVVDWENNKFCKTLNSDHLKDNEIMVDYIKNLIFKKIIGCYDLADRNFLICKDKKFYSVDEEDSGQDFMVYENLKKYDKDIIAKKFIINNINLFKNLINSWVKKLQVIESKDSEKINKILKTLQSINLYNF